MNKSYVKSILIGLSLLTMTCKEKVSDENKIPLAHFQAYLRKGMDCDSVIRTFGEPDRIEGSGLSILYYQMGGETEMMIGCGGNLIYARQVDSTGKTVTELID